MAFVIAFTTGCTPCPLHLNGRGIIRICVHTIGEDHAITQLRLHSDGLVPRSTVFDAHALHHSITWVSIYTRDLQLSLLALGDTGIFCGTH